ncbi:hypothetical protein Psfp_02237 [Pelotomaculum sp. FP]|uniref:hypothetical protein n=1 Tax=Pelotomaculum sp. FP TaxID=261474 RepID=UPI0010660A12|nr:hypothetical protein [Pelotomaculum sp. FP]TEB15320.1 hypothetical protein Psfp_02237 [Pelotomaculum sp. FP]
MRAGRHKGVKVFVHRTAYPGGGRPEAIPFLRRILRKYRLGRSGRGFPALYYLRPGGRIIYEQRSGPAAAGFPLGLPASNGLPGAVSIHPAINYLTLLPAGQSYNRLQPLSLTKSGVSFTGSLYPDWRTGGARTRGRTAGVGYSADAAPGYAALSAAGKPPAAGLAPGLRLSLSGAGIFGRYQFHRGTGAPDRFEISLYAQNRVYHQSRFFVTRRRGGIWYSSQDGFTRRYRGSTYPQNTRRGGCDFNRTRRVSAALAGANVTFVRMNSHPHFWMYTFGARYLQDGKLELPESLPAKGNKTQELSDAAMPYNRLAAVNHTNEPASARMMRARPAVGRFLQIPVFRGTAISGGPLQPAAGPRRPLQETAASGRLNANKPAPLRTGLRGAVQEQNQKRPLPETAVLERSNANKSLPLRTAMRAAVPEQTQKRRFPVPGEGYRGGATERTQRRSLIKAAGVRRVPEYNGGSVPLPAMPERLERLSRHRASELPETGVVGPSYAGSGKTYYPPVRMDVPAGHVAKEPVVQDVVAAGRRREAPGNDPAYSPEDFLRRNDNRSYRFETREDLNRLADRVCSLIERKIRIERERRGKPCW